MRGQRRFCSFFGDSFREDGEDGFAEGFVEVEEDEAAALCFAGGFNLAQDGDGAEAAFCGGDADAAEDFACEAGIGGLGAEPIGKGGEVLGVVHGEGVVDEAHAEPGDPVLSHAVDAGGVFAVDGGREGDAGGLLLQVEANVLHGVGDVLGAPDEERRAFGAVGLGDAFGPIRSRAAVFLEAGANAWADGLHKAGIAHEVEVNAVDGVTGRDFNHGIAEVGADVGVGRVEPIELFPLSILQHPALVAHGLDGPRGGTFAREAQNPRMDAHAVLVAGGDGLFELVVGAFCDEDL